MLKVILEVIRKMQVIKVFHNRTPLIGLLMRLGQKNYLINHTRKLETVRLKKIGLIKEYFTPLGFKHKLQLTCCPE